MNFTAGELYHIYNRGNDKKTIFFTPDNYFYFLTKVKKYICPNCDILSYCLMPNHFHFFIHANEISEIEIVKGCLQSNPLSEGFKTLLSSYTKAINHQENRIGHLFQQNTKAKLLVNSKHDYSMTCFHYTHQNPYKAGIVKKMEDWPFSSFRDYIGQRDDTLCNKELATALLGLDPHTLYWESYTDISKEMIEKLFRSTNKPRTLATLINK